MAEDAEFRDEAPARESGEYDLGSDSSAVFHDEAPLRESGERDLAPDAAAETDLLDAAPGAELDPRVGARPAAPPAPAPSPRPPAPRPPLVRREPVTGAEPVPTTCAGCGAQNAASAAVCGRCGAAIAPPIPPLRGGLAPLSVGSPYLARATSAAAEPAPGDPFAALPPDVRARLVADRDARADLKRRLGERWARARRRFVLLMAALALGLGLLPSWILLDGAAFAACALLDAVLGAAFALGLLHGGSGWRDLSGAVLGGLASGTSALLKALAVVLGGGTLVSLAVFVPLLAQCFVSVYAGRLISDAVEGGAFDGGLLEKLAP